MSENPVRSDPPKEKDRWARYRGMPWTIKAYAIAYVVGSLVFSYLWTPPGPSESQLMFAIESVFWMAVFSAVIVLPIMRGSKFGWVFITLLTVATATLIPRATSLIASVVVIVNLVVTLFFLLHPATQQWCRIRLGRTQSH